ncbi:hypothetical protein MD484_g429, partial [Candolleomyces efflorescens]
MNSTKNETLKSTSSTPPFSPELLREIFLFLALDTANQRRNICAVSLVCTQWAHVAYSTKELWTAMHHILHEDEEMSEDSPASRFLSNLEFVTGMARGLPLEINWVADHELEDWWQPFINTALQRIAEKVSDLTLDLHRIGIIRAIQQKRRGQGYPSIASWPELKKLKLRSQDTTGTILNSFQATTGNMPLLVDLSLINISVEELAPFSPPGFPRVQPMFPWPQLVRLQLSQPDLIVDIALVLYRCRALEECSFCVKLMVILSGFVSLLAVMFVFGIIIRNVIRQRRKHWRKRWRILVDPVDVIMLSVFIGDAIQALGAIVGSIKWVNEGKVDVGAYCTAQGVLKQLGEASVPLNILLLAVYTFRGIWMGKKSESLLMTKFLVTGIWVFVVLIVILGNVLHRHKKGKDSYIAPVPYWCWINSPYMQWRIWGEYFWFWLTLGVSILTYIPLFLWFSGQITQHPESWWKFKIRRASSPEANDFPRDLENEATSKIMLLYPAIFCITVMPLSVVRWIRFQQEHHGPVTIPPAADFASLCFLVLSGAFNVTLLLTTRPNTVLFGRRDATESFMPQHGNPREGAGSSLKATTGSAPSTPWSHELEVPRGRPSNASDSVGRLPPDS